MTAVPMPTVDLAPGLTVSAQGYGAMSLTPVYGPISDEAALHTLARAIDIGITFIDTANVYGEGHSEELVGRVLRDRRDEVQLATKFGLSRGTPGAGRSIDGHPDSVRPYLEASLGRLGVDHVDLYYLHRVDLSVPIEDTVGAMAQLVADGKVRYLGLSEVTADELRRAHAVHPIAAVQSEWSIFSRDVERAVVPAAADLGVGFVPYSPVSRGLLSDAFDPDQIVGADMRAHFPRFGADAIAHNLTLRKEVRAVAAEANATTPQVALAWLAAAARRLGVVSVPIPGTRHPQRVEENAAAVAVELTDEQVARLDGLAEQVIGNRSADPTWVSAGRE